MKVLLIGGTGTISTAVTERAVQEGFEVTLVNRGSRTAEVPKGVRLLTADMRDEEQAACALKGQTFDVVANFIGFVPEQVERDIRLFSGITGQYIYISSASAYQKPLAHYLVTESTPLSNPYWQYSRDKIACEGVLMKEYREKSFPVTIVRPSHTYGKRAVPMAINGKKGSWQVLDRMLHGKPVILHGDGLSLWTMTYNTDFAKAFVGLMGNPHAIGEAVHITSDESLTWNQIYEIVGAALGVKPEIRHLSTEFLTEADPSLRAPLLGDKANSVVFDNSKIKRLVPGFTATVRFDQGVPLVLDYIRSHEECRIPDPDFDLWCDRVLAVSDRARREFQGK